MSFVLIVFRDIPLGNFATWLLVFFFCNVALSVTMVTTMLKQLLK